MATLADKLVGNQFLRFVLAGGLAAIVNFGSRFVYSVMVDFRIAVVLAFFTGLGTAYLLTKRYVFIASRNPVAHELGWFFVVNMFGLAQTWGLSVYLAEYFLQGRINPSTYSQATIQAASHFVGILLPIFTSFIGHKYLTFRE
jgi:putative flippase GtrA